jgi:predicted GH43/DUF377 family glycosyl hydrolase
MTPLKLSLLALVAGVIAPTPAQQYSDGRAAATLRYEAKDQGIVLAPGACPNNCDRYGARDVWVFRHGKHFYMHYDAAGETGWLTALATSDDLVHWQKHGTVLQLGPPGSRDSASASYGTTYFDGKRWYMFYLGTPHTSPAPDRIPAFPYLTLEAHGASPMGPWTKVPEITPFAPKARTYYSATASPGQIIRYKGEYLQFFSASTDHPTIRTLSIARTKELDHPWKVDANPILPPHEQIENSSIYFEKKIATWFLFTNHVGVDRDGEYTDSIWVYWSKDLNHWRARDKAVVLDGRNSTWSSRCIGLPSVVPMGNKLAIFYDAPGGDSVSHMHRSLGLAWLTLPFKRPE